ncbi:MAG: S24 family peptidase [Truepera sp.]|nr:S24 family peptidase [Truepera sp.]
MFPVYASVSAGDKDPSPIDGEVVYFPAEKLRAKGVKPAFVRFYVVNGDCMVSDEVRRIEKNIAPHDYIAVDTEHRPRPGDVVVAWWRDEEKLIVKRYKIEGENIILYPTNPGHPQIVLPSEDEVIIIGRVVGRTG